MDFISDKFENNTAQNPLFVVKAKYMRNFVITMLLSKEKIASIISSIKLGVNAAAEHSKFT